MITLFFNSGLSCFPRFRVLDLPCSLRQSFLHLTFALHCRYRRWDDALRPETLSIWRMGESLRVPCRVTRRASQKTFQTIDHVNKRLLLYAAIYRQTDLDSWRTPLGLCLQQIHHRSDSTLSKCRPFVPFTVSYRFDIRNDIVHRDLKTLSVQDEIVGFA